MFRLAFLLSPILTLVLTAGSVHADDGAPLNPYGIEALWAQGDLVARGTLGLLGMMSLFAWYVLITRSIEQSLLMREARRAERAMDKAAHPADGVMAMGDSPVFGVIGRAGLAALRTLDANPRPMAADANTLIGLALQPHVGQAGADLQKGLTVLATVGSTAPFVGLFGTVWGIYHALTAIGITGQASIDKVAGPVGEALIMTAIGLAVAVPAVLGYNWLARRNKVLSEKIRFFALRLHASLLAGAGR